MTIDSVPTAGALVLYHGSLDGYHGPCRFTGVCGTCTRCWGGSDRFRLVHLATEETLSCVRRESVSPLPAGYPTQGMV